MDTDASTSANQSSSVNHSSGSEVTSDSGVSPIKKARACTKSSTSPTLKAFGSLEDALAQFRYLVQTKHE